MAKTKTIPSHKNIVGFSNYLAGGDANATILLARIVYWMPLATITHNGHRWIAKSLADWCAEACLEHWTCRRALATLRKRGLVCTERHLFKHYNLTHVRLTADAIAAFSGEGVPATLRKNGRSEACNAAPKSASKSARFFNTGDTEQELQTKKENKNASSKSSQGT